MGDHVLYPEARYNYEKGINEYILSAIPAEDWNIDLNIDWQTAGKVGYTIVVGGMGVIICINGVWLMGGVSLGVLVESVSS